MQKRVVSMWFPRLPSDRVLRVRAFETHSETPFVLTQHQQNTQRVYCLNKAAEKHGLYRGMGFSDARSYCPELQSQPANTNADSQFLQVLARWGKRYCPWVGVDGDDGLLLNVSGSTHLFGGEQGMLVDMRQRLARAQINARIGVADTRGAAWALAHYGDDATLSDVNEIAKLPIAALRVDAKTDMSLQRVGLRKISDLLALPRASITRRFGGDVLLRLDQTLGRQPEQISPLQDAPHYGVRMTFPDPIGLYDDVMAGTERLLDRLCEKLKAQEMGARVLQLTLRRVDKGNQQVELRLAAPLRDRARILPLFERGVRDVDAGFGIDQLRLAAVHAEPLPNEQITPSSAKPRDGLDDLITRLGNRIGLENIQRFHPADSHIPERSYQISPAAYSDASGGWVALRPRPLRLFPPETIRYTGQITSRPPMQFHWRKMFFSIARATGPERIAPEWWLPDDNWRSGLRDYWRIETRQGRRLWLFFTPQNPNWFAQGEFA